MWWGDVKDIESEAGKVGVVGERRFVWGRGSRGAVVVREGWRGDSEVLRGFEE